MEFYTQKNDIGKMLEINLGFHGLIYAASHNKMLTRLLSSYQIYSKYLSANTEYSTTYLDEVLEEHRAIFQAFKDKDVAAGIKAMEFHMDRARDRKLLK